MRFAAVGLLVVAGLLASCSAAHGRPGAQSRAGTRSQAGGRPAGTRAPVHAQATAGARLKISRGPWWQREASPCAPPALVRAAGHVMGVGTCIGQLSRPPQKVTLIVGQRLDVHMQAAGVIRLPHSSFPSVLMPGAMSQDGATQTYLAARPGHAVLSSDVRACFAYRHGEVKEIPGSCPVIAVTVVP